MAWGVSSRLRTVRRLPSGKANCGAFGPRYQIRRGAGERAAEAGWAMPGETGAAWAGARAPSRAAEARTATTTARPAVRPSVRLSSIGAGRGALGSLLAGAAQAQS